MPSVASLLSVVPIQSPDTRSTMSIPSPIRPPEVAQSPHWTPSSPAIINGGVAINVDVAVDVGDRAVEEPQQSDDDDDEDEDDDAGDGDLQYMLQYDPRSGVFNLAHAIEEAREKGDVGNLDKEGSTVLLHKKCSPRGRAIIAGSTRKQ
jgi:hypothetical protein